MKNYNLTLSIVPNAIHSISNREEKALLIEDFEWIRKKSLISKSIKNYRSVIDCITSIISENIPEHLINTIQVTDNSYFINSKNAPVINEILDDFVLKYKIAIQKHLTQIIYVYEVKTFAEITKEINNHIKIISDFLNHLQGDMSLILNSNYNSN